MDDADLTDQNKLFEKVLSFSDVKNPMAIPTDALEVFQIPEGERKMLFEATDKLDQHWSFTLSIRPDDPNRRPTLGKEWPSFSKKKGLKAGDKIEMYRIQSEGDEVTYKIRAYRMIFKVWAPIV